MQARSLVDGGLSQALIGWNYRHALVGWFSRIDHEIDIEILVFDTIFIIHIIQKKGGFWVFFCDIAFYDDPMIITYNAMHIDINYQRLFIFHDFSTSVHHLVFRKSHD